MTSFRLSVTLFLVVVGFVVVVCVFFSVFEMCLSWVNSTLCYHEFASFVHVFCGSFIWFFFSSFFHIWNWIQTQIRMKIGARQSTYLSLFISYTSWHSMLFSLSLSFSCVVLLCMHTVVSVALHVYELYTILLFLFILIIRFVFAETHRSDEIKSVKMWLHGTQIWYVRLLQTDLTINWFEHNTRIDWTIQKI